MSDCPHPEAQLDEAISHLGDPDWAFCYGCRSVLKKDDGWTAQPTLDAADVCGETFDHNLRVIDERDGWVTYECRTCGAEVVEPNGEYRP